MHKGTHEDVIHSIAQASRAALDRSDAHREAVEQIHLTASAWEGGDPAKVKAALEALEGFASRLQRA